ncbi:putative phage abortive infection protein [Epilithonimonas zeae]|uniref:Putative phage abortive infection protein n=1 Tax=Epilithonimonas zeae TaxID=1416779 RepID=A0A1N6FTH4_9FLAO|nr:putative phage abortive infection protein [Epilithonimonas zeae]SIN98522.1 Putative phage abortive infection protein [Epilithonimonas zeae]
MSNIQHEIDISIQRIESKQVEISAKIEILEKRISKFNGWAWFFVGTGALISIVATIYFFIVVDNSQNFQLNLLGDFLAGSVASVWSLAGLFFIYVAFLGQKQQLLNQQLEIMYSQLEVKNTRLELAGQKEEMRIQNETLRQQKFENTFFNLLNLLSSVVNSIDIRNIRTQNVMSSGRDCFKIFYGDFVAIINKDHEKDREFEITKISIPETIKSYDKYFHENQSDLSHYFRSVYHILKFIDSSDIEDKKRYVGLVRAQISSYEQILIFYNCFHPYGTKLKVLAKDHNFFKSLDEKLLINESHYDDFAKDEI